VAAFEFEGHVQRAATLTTLDVVDMPLDALPESVASGDAQGGDSTDLHFALLSMGLLVESSRNWA